jgi:hypothetical protein
MYLVVRNFTNSRVRINSLKMETEDSYETLVNLYHIARNYNTALSGTVSKFSLVKFPKYFACNLEYISRFVNRKNVHWGASLQHFRSVSFLLLFLSDASFVSGRTFPAVRYGGRLSGLWRDQQSPLYAGSHPIALSSALWKERWDWSQQNRVPHRVGQNRTSSGHGLVAAGKQGCTLTCLLFMRSCAL